MNRSMSTAEYFELICKILEEKGMMPDILDYALPDYNPKDMITCEFDLRSNLDYGGSEGIYLNLWISYEVDGEKASAGIGTFKTLRTDREAMRIMGALLADFIVEQHSYVNAHLDDFEWSGVKVYVYNEKGEKSKWSYSCKDMAQAIQKKDWLLNKYPVVILRDNTTHRETIYKRDLIEKIFENKEKEQMVRRKPL